jgi:hypothetical protein
MTNDFYFRNHTITFVHGFPPLEDPIEGLREITPPELVTYFKNFTDWDIVSGRRNTLYTVPFEDQFILGPTVSADTGGYTIIHVLIEFKQLFMGSHLPTAILELRDHFGRS